LLTRAGGAFYAIRLKSVCREPDLILPEPRGLAGPGNGPSPHVENMNPLTCLHGQHRERQELAYSPQQRRFLFCSEILDASARACILQHVPNASRNIHHLSHFTSLVSASRQATVSQTQLSPVYPDSKLSLPAQCCHRPLPAQYCPGPPLYFHFLAALPCEARRRSPG